MHAASFGFAIVGSEIALLVVMTLVLCGSSSIPFWKNAAQFICPTLSDWTNSFHATTSVWSCYFKGEIAIVLCSSLYALSRGVIAIAMCCPAWKCSWDLIRFPDIVNPFLRRNEVTTSVILYVTVYTMERSLEHKQYTLSYCSMTNPELHALFVKADELRRECNNHYSCDVSTGFDKKSTIEIVELKPRGRNCNPM